MKCYSSDLYTITLFLTIIYSCLSSELLNNKGQETKNGAPIAHNSDNFTNQENKTLTDSFASYIRIQNPHDKLKSNRNLSMKTFRKDPLLDSKAQNNSGAKRKPSANGKPKKELPVALIIAGPTAAVSIFIFLCVAYYFHNAQLNKKAKRLSVTLFVSQDIQSISSNCSSPTGMVPYSHRYIHTTRNSRDSDILGPRRKSMISIHTLSMPPSIMGKRGSNWSALADQEILSLSAPRRHSTFIL